MVNFNPNVSLNPINMANGAENIPPIVLCLTDPKAGLKAQAQAPDRFEKQPQEKPPVMIDSNDKFVPSSNPDNNLKEFTAPNQMLGAKFNPEEAKKFGEEALKWGKRVWTGMEIYDTLDGYRQRFTNDDKNV